MKKRLILRNSQGYKLVGILHHVNNNVLFVICHGFRGSKNDFVINEMCQLLQNRGFSACRFDLAGHGESEGSKIINVTQQIQDILSISSYFKGQYKKIILVGGSLGGLVTTLATLENEQTSGLVTINGFFYLEKVAWRYYKYLLLTILSVPFSRQSRQMISYYFSKFKPGKIEVPTLVIYGDRDETVNYRQSLKFHNNLTSKKTLGLIKDADHALTKSKYVSCAVELITNWFKKI